MTLQGVGSALTLLFPIVGLLIGQQYGAIPYYILLGIPVLTAIYLIANKELKLAFNLTALRNVLIVGVAISAIMVALNINVWGMESKTVLLTLASVGVAIAIFEVVKK